MAGTSLSHTLTILNALKKKPTECNLNRVEQWNTPEMGHEGNTTLRTGRRKGGGKGGRFRTRKPKPPAGTYQVWTYFVFDRKSLTPNRTLR